MKKNLFVVGMLATFSLVKSQVGINTTNPQGVFNIDGLKNNPTTGTPTAAQAKDDLVTTSNGNLGLGVITPGTTLDVNGAITNRETPLAVTGNAVTIPANVSLVQLTGAATTNITVTAPVAPNAGQRLIVYNNTTGGFGATLNGVTVPNGKAQEFIFSNSSWKSIDGSSGGGSSVNIYNTDGTLTGNRTVTQGANTLAFTGTQTNAFSVDGTTLSVDAANGRVGIGTTTPDTKLTISTPDNSFGLNHTNGSVNFKSYIGGGVVSVGTTTANDLRFTTNNTQKMTITPAGDVGIGTTTPDAKLTITAPDNSFGLHQTNGAVSLKSYIGGGVVSVGTTTANDLRFTTNNTQKMTITSAGNVGVGTVTPTNKLVVAGSNGQPSALGTATTNATLRVDGNSNHALDFGTYANFPYGSYISSQNKTSAAGLPLVLNPVGGNVGVGTNAPDNSALLELNTTNRGFLLPRVSLTSMTDGSTIPSPAKALMVYNSNTGLAPYGEGVYYNSGTSTAPSWSKLAPQTTDYQLLGVFTDTATFPVDQLATGNGVIINNLDLGLSVSVTVPANSTAKIVVDYNVPVGTTNTASNELGYYGVRFIRNGGEEPAGSRKYTIPEGNNGSQMVSTVGKYAETYNNTSASPVIITYTLNGYVESTNHPVRFNMWAASGQNFNWGVGSISATAFAKDN
ncbi:beta strand repeat-containing protein [Chryseobacterium sp. AG363]|uniref:beta strand repeat-containing protein n=1 Tax=Chryseobacterium sp. AG363 TaxID=2183997 RepID=UPI000E74CEB8|nr:hypothetical protein [Chryseobacterium sp. AG363]RKE82809.1 hypothetical protein DEU39_2371 [Chryseobacterium sp. AG363]